MLFVLLLVVCLQQFASDIYAPSLPAIASSLNAPIHLAQWSMAIYTLGVALSALIYGPLSEGIGRKKPMLAGIAIMVWGTALCTFAPNIDLLILGRFIQGCGAGACVLWRATFRDIFTGEELAKYGSSLSIFIMFILPAAPVLGGYLQEFFGWRANFIFMLVYAVIAFIALIYGFKETHQEYHADKLNFNYIIPTYKILLRSRIFVGITLCTFFSFGAFFTWFTVGSVLLIHVVGISPVKFGWLNCLGGGVAYALAGWLNSKVVKRFGMPLMMRLGWAGMILAGILMVLGYGLIGVETWVIMGPIILFYFASTFIWPNAFATAFSPFGHIAGYAAALYTCMQIGGGAVVGGLVVHLPAHNQLSLGFVLILASAIAWVVYEKVVFTKL